MKRVPFADIANSFNGREYLEDIASRLGEIEERIVIYDKEQQIIYYAFSVPKYKILVDVENGRKPFLPVKMLFRIDRNSGIPDAKLTGRGMPFLDLSPVMHNGKEAYAIGKKDIAEYTTIHKTTDPDLFTVLERMIADYYTQLPKPRTKS
ncbi:MAG: hypothetical protein ABIA93_02570 [Candidatus Woesearchaeota archaeon]